MKSNSSAQIRDQIASHASADVKSWDLSRSISNSTIFNVIPWEFEISDR